MYYENYQFFHRRRRSPGTGATPGDSAPAKKPHANAVSRAGGHLQKHTAKAGIGRGGNPVVRLCPGVPGAGFAGAVRDPTA